MKLGIVGAGSMGRIFAYFAVNAGIDAVVYTGSRETAEALSCGLRVIIDDNVTEWKICADTAPGVLSTCDIIFLSVKAYSTENALRDIAGSIHPDSIIVSLQNGLGNAELLSKHLPGNRLVFGTTSIGATKIDRSSVMLGGMGTAEIGGKDEAAVRKVAEMLNAMTIEAGITADPDEALWRKAIVNAGINPICALLAVPNGLILSNDSLMKLQENIIREAVDVAAAMGHPFNADKMIELTRTICRKTAKNRCSMLQDLAGKDGFSGVCRTEIDSINGKIIEYGTIKKIPTPVNSSVYYLIKGKETISPC